MGFFWLILGYVYMVGLLVGFVLVGGVYFVGWVVVFIVGSLVLLWIGFVCKGVVGIGQCIVLLLCVVVLLCVGGVVLWLVYWIML